MKRRRDVPAHYIRHNIASRWPHRWICWDSETRWQDDGPNRVHYFRCAVGCWWDHNTKRNAEPTYGAFTDATAFWAWVSEHTTREGRTIAYAHNLGFDVQATRMFEELPLLGWNLEWFNMDRDATLIVWRKEQRTLVLADTLTLFPASLETIAGMVDPDKAPLPDNDAPAEEWQQRCELDVQILTAAVREFIEWGRDFDVGNWRPSGSGLAWSLWRHRFLECKILAHSGPDNLAVEREGMVTGRAEAWRTGELPNDGAYLWDMARCYCRIASQAMVPVRHLVTVPRLTVEQYRQWAAKWSVLARVRVTQAEPIVGVKDGTGFRWPIGTFETVLWEPEIDLLLERGASVELGESRRYVRAPALRSWAEWTMGQLAPETATVPPVVGLWVKSQSRSLIGRMGMQYRAWDEHPDGNGLDITGISKEARPGERARTLVHVAHRCWVEGERTNADDAVPAITGWVMSEARVRLYRAMLAAGERNLWHVDTDGLLVSREGHYRMRRHAAENPDHGWTEKGHWYDGRVNGTRNYELDGKPHIAGVPRRAVKVGPNEWEGETWQSVRGGLERGMVDRVVVRTLPYRLTAPDSRRHHQLDGSTRPYAPGEFDELYPRRARVARTAEIAP